MLSFSVGSTGAMQCEDGGPWIHGVIEEANNNGHIGRSYIITVMKTGRVITQNTRHICNTPIPPEQYLQ